MIIHTHLSSGRWFELSLIEQLANVGTDIERTIQWKKKGNVKYSRKAFERALELLDLTIADQKNKKRFKELLRVREALADYFIFDNKYSSTDESWHTYFFCFNYAAAVRRGR
ncbi:hypothetical protein E3J79_04135 [Candidatus Dependentiae bacterium]|nr:MAG: hypothetical protein E3J79_04135 [Candidatus Dependentiae bacterium]